MCLVAKCVDCGHEELTANAECPCGCHFKVPETLLVKDGIVSSLQAHIAALEAENAGLREQVAAADARLAMVVEAILRYQKDEVALDEGEIEPPYLAEALIATAESVAAWRERVKAEGARDEFDRGWRHAKGEILAALGCDWEGIYLAAKEPWAVKVAEMLKAAKADGAAEALTKAAEDAQRHRSECMYYGELEARAEEQRRQQ